MIPPKGGTTNGAWPAPEKHASKSHNGYSLGEFWTILLASRGTIFSCGQLSIGRQNTMAKKAATKKATTKKAAAKKAAPKKATTKKAAAKKASKKKGAEDDAAPVKKKKAKRKSKKKVVEDVRLRVFWGVFNHAMKRVALYDFNQRKAAEKRAKELSPEGKPPHFVQKIKEEIDVSEIEDPDAPADAKATKKATKKAAKKATKKKTTKK